MNASEAAELAQAVLRATEGGIVLFMLLLNSCYATQLLLSIPEVIRNWRIADDENLRMLRGAEVVPPISVLVPAYNEENTIVASVLSFLSLEYPRHEVIVVNDGSTDGTLERLTTAYELEQVPPAYAAVVPTHPVRGYYRSRVHTKLACVDKENGGGKGDALNAALNAARYPYVLVVDADTFIERDALLRIARPFLLGQEVAAVGGTVRIANGSLVEHGRVVEAHVDRRWIPGIQTIEYLRAFLFGRLGWNRLGGGLIVSGAFGLFKVEHLQAIKGYAAGTVTEDIDVVVRLLKHLRDTKQDDIITFVPDPVAWTEGPVTIAVLGAQRERWHRGLVATMVQHRDMLFNPRYGFTGMVAFPFFFFGEMLAPLVEITGYIVLLLSIFLGVVNAEFALMFLGVSIGYSFLLSMWAVVMEEISFRRYARRRDIMLLLWYCVLENFGFRQITVFYRALAFIRYVRGDTRWGVMTREGPRTAPVGWKQA